MPGAPAAPQVENGMVDKPVVANQAAGNNVVKPVVPAAEEVKPKKKICCACPDSKKERDECIVLNGEEACQSFIDAHKQCLRLEGFNV